MRIGSFLSPERGDTIIEVIFAIVIFSFVAINSMTIMNKGLAAGERALEVTLVRQQINAQAEALRYIHDARVVTPVSNYGIIWSELVSDYGQAVASPFGVNNNRCLLPEGNSYNPFVLNARNPQAGPSIPTIESSANSGLPPYPQVVYDNNSSITAAYGLWVEAVPSDSPLARQFVDFHIRACWPAPGSAVPMTIGTIVRLYDPA